MRAIPIKEWYNRFKDGLTSMQSKTRYGRSSTSRNEIVVNQLRTRVMQNRRIIRELTDKVGVSIGSVHSIMREDLGFWRISAKFVPKLLAIEEKQLRLETAQDILEILTSSTQ
ncbi:protein GVQW3-like [Oratosquilla oratoria]|uniref:protein GVQW3-like n=1 Tax=Oratosquilla oratoria TaxID=337810 RepID=UPI003F774E91